VQAERRSLTAFRLTPAYMALRSVLPSLFAYSTLTPVFFAFDLVLFVILRLHGRHAPGINLRDSALRRGSSGKGEAQDTSSIGPCPACGVRESKSYAKAPSSTPLVCRLLHDIEGYLRQTLWLRDSLSLRAPPSN
jgi:hypothetical protein